MKKFLTIEDLAQRYSVSKASIFNYVRTGKLPAGIRIGKSHRWNIQELEAFELSLSGYNKVRYGTKIKEV